MNAFQACNALQSVTIGITTITDDDDRVTNIGDHVFNILPIRLQSVTIGDSIKSIDPNAFKYCICVYQTVYMSEATRSLSWIRKRYGVYQSFYGSDKDTIKDVQLFDK